MEIGTIKSLERLINRNLDWESFRIVKMQVDVEQVLDQCLLDYFIMERKIEINY